MKRYITACALIALAAMLLASCALHLTADQHKDSITPAAAFPGEIVDIRTPLGMSTDILGYQVLFGKSEAAFIEPIIDYENGSKVVGVTVVAPADARSGPIEIVTYTDKGRRSVFTRSTFTARPLTVDYRLPRFRESALLGLLLRPRGARFKRLPLANFNSEVADSKDVVIADFDGDTDLDVFVPQTLDASETLYENTGNSLSGLPNFTVHADVVSNDLPAKRQYGAMAADLDNDGDLDVVPSGAGQGGDGIRLLINDGTGRFANEAPARVSGLAGVTGSAFDWDDVAVGDIDNDGDLDIALSNRSTSPTTRSAYLENDGHGNFVAHPDAFGEPGDDVHHDIVMCDLNADGLPEIAITQDMRGDQRPLRILLNNGPGATPQFTDISSALAPNPNHHSEHLGCVDLNNDDKPDLHVGVWRRSDRDAASERAREDFIALNNSVDSDGSGIIDGDEISLGLVNNPEISGSILSGFDTQIYSAAYGDFDRDGLVDIVLGSMVQTGAKGPFLMRNRGNGRFVNISPPNTFWHDLTNITFDHFNPTSPSVADLNGDGLLDIVFGMGDGMNGPSREANRIYIQQGRIAIDLCDLFPSRACLVAEIPRLERGGIVVPPIPEGGIAIDPIPRNCLVKFECPGCGGPFGLCANEYTFMLDLTPFQAAGINMRATLIDGNGKVISKPEPVGNGRVALRYNPARFKEHGVDQDISIAFENISGPAKEVEIRMDLDVSPQQYNEEREGVQTPM